MGFLDLQSFQLWMNEFEWIWMFFGLAVIVLQCNGIIITKKNQKKIYSRNGIYMPWSGEKVKKKVFFLKKNPNFFFCVGEGGRYRYSSIRSFALTLSTPMNRVNKNFEKNDCCAFNMINHPSKYQTRNLNEYHFRPLLLVKNPILPYGHENLRAFFSRFYLGSTYQIDTKVVGLW